MEILRRNIREFDFTLVGILLLLGVYSCVSLYAIGKPLGDTSWVKQTVYEIAGVFVMFGVALYDYRSIRRWRWWLYALTIVLLVAVFGFHSVYGAHSWINLKVITFQPSELAKLALIIVMGHYMAAEDDSEFPQRGLRSLFPLGLMMIVIFALIFIEPALGQALVIFAIFMTMFVMFTRRSYFTILTLLLLVFVFGLAYLAVTYPTQLVDFIQHVLVKHHILHGYQSQRILTWLDPNYSITHYGYNVHEARIAIGSGQVFGQGLLGGIITNAGIVPNQTNDFIFTVIGEEFGFVGSSILVFLYLILVYRLIRIAATSQDSFGTYYIVGLIGMIAFQVFENIGMDMYLSPSTGITLPFISYGGTSLIINYISMGLVLSVALRRKSLRFSRP